MHSRLIRFHVAALSVAVLLVLGAIAVPAVAETFAPTTVSYPGSTSTAASSINNRGDIVGTYSCAASCVNPLNQETSTPGTHGFLLQHGVYKRIDVPATAIPADCPTCAITATVPRGISPQGIVVGNYIVSFQMPGTPGCSKLGICKVNHGFAYFAGTYVAPIDVPAELFDHPDSALRNTILVGISPEGDLVGCFHEDSQTMTTMHGWLLHRGSFSVLTTPHSAGDNSSHDPDTMNNGISPNGTITGFYSSAGVSYVADKQNRILTTFTFADNPNFVTLAQDINARGDVVGQYLDAQGNAHGFLRAEDAEYRTLDVDGALATAVFGINAHREIVGEYIDATGAANGFVYRLSPDDDQENDSKEHD